MNSQEAASNLENEKEHSRWTSIWSNEETPAFDKGLVCPALANLEDKGLIPLGRALVPGMGRGYDVTFLAKPERICIGIDIVEV